MFQPSAQAVKRIEDVRLLRTAQFQKTLAPWRTRAPDSYVEINNFYTVTVWRKKALRLYA